jgi:hypothetical protein
MKLWATKCLYIPETSSRGTAATFIDHSMCVVVFFLFQKNFSPGEEIVKTSNVVSPLMDVPASFFSFLYTSACVLHWYYIPAAIGLSPSQRNRCIIYPHVCVIASISRVSLFFSLETRAVCIPFLYLQACLYGIPTPANQKDETCVC